MGSLRVGMYCISGVLGVAVSWRAVMAVVFFSQLFCYLRETRVLACQI